MSDLGSRLKRLRIVIDRDGEVVDDIPDCDNVVALFTRMCDDGFRFVNLTRHGDSADGGVEFGRIRSMWEYLTASMHEVLASNGIDADDAMRYFFDEIMGNVNTTGGGN